MAQKHTSKRNSKRYWEHISNLAKSSDLKFRIRIAIGSQDHTNLTDNLPKASRIRLDDGFNAQNIDAFIDDRLSRHSGFGQLLNHDPLRAEVQQLLKAKANGM
jgi:hypothetical protein